MPIYLNNKKVSPTVVYPPVSAGDYDFYEGPYTVDPLAAANTTLSTAQKVLTNDVTVYSIRYNEVSNVAGGYTAYIGL